MDDRKPVCNSTTATLPQLQRRIRVALGQEPGDIVLCGGQVVNVFTRKIQPANIVIADGWIAGVGAFEWKARQTVFAENRFIIPGLIDGHMHVESTLLMPEELARVFVPLGTTALIADPHEVGNVQGIAGIDHLLKASAGLPLDFFFMASSCVPAVHWDHAGAVLGPEEVAQLLTRPRILGLAEVMDMNAVLRGDPWVLEKVRAALGAHCAVDGHAPGLHGRDLIAYVSAGIRADHESTTLEEARAKAALGMMIQVREGSAEHNLDTLLPGLVADELGDWCLATDDLLPNDICANGHINGLLRRVVAGGVPAAKAVRHASYVPAQHYGLNDRGAIAPGYRADIVVMNDLTSFQPHLVVKNGQIVACDGEYLGPTRNGQEYFENTVHVGPMDESAFILPLKNETVPVIRVVPHQIVTQTEMQSVHRANGCWAFDPNRDVLLAASIERHRGTGSRGLGLVSGFGLRQHGALGSSVAHDAHNLIIAGSNPRDMLVCIRAMIEMGGGFVVVSQGKVLARLPLPAAGLLSREPVETVCRQLTEVDQAARQLGCRLDEPFGYLSFLALPVIPELRITDQGLYDVNSQQFVQI